MRVEILAFYNIEVVLEYKTTKTNILAKGNKKISYIIE